MHSYVPPWYYPKNKVVKLEVMEQNTIQRHDRLKETMYYVRWSLLANNGQVDLGWCARMIWGLHRVLN